MMNLYEKFKSEHGRIMGLFRGIIQSLPEDPGTARDHFSEFAREIKRHMKGEEEVLFPLLVSKKEALSESFDVFREEHQTIRSRMKALRERMDSDPEEARDRAQSLLETIKNHDRKEEQVLYPAIPNLLSEEEREEIRNQLEAE